MTNYNKRYIKYWNFASGIFSDINWTNFRKIFTGKSYDLTYYERKKIKTYCADNYYIILINRKSHFTTYALGLLAFLKTGKWPTYSHALMNVDSESKIINWKKFKFMEATIKGVNWVGFNKVFNCDKVCLLKPKNVSLEEWDSVMTKLLTQRHKKYDTLFDLSDDTRVSCVELVRIALKAVDDYEKKFYHFENMIESVGNLTPQMFRDCEDFEVFYET